jgi:uncharacterized protein YlxW (UPF0749 family)
VSPLRSARPNGWAALVPVVALLAGLLFATSGKTALGTDLRAGDSSELSSLIDQRNGAVARQQEELSRLRADIQRLTDQAALRYGEVAQAQAGGEQELVSAGLTPITGAGLEIVLDDAPRSPGGGLPAGATGDDVVIHQSDVQAVVNALWAAGADGVAIMGQRLIATSAVRCVGNTLLLHGRTYSPPFVVTAIGDAGAMQDQLAASSGVALLQQAVDDFGLTFQVRRARSIDLPEYDGSFDMQYADAG